jgi:hypothetical protein
VKCLIAISTCYDFEKNGSNDALRETWLPDVGKFPELDYRLFVGRGQGAEDHLLMDELPRDMILLPDVEDDYGHLTYKTRASLRWAHAQNYDFVFRCFPDSYVRVDRLMNCGFTENDYHGDFRGDAKVNALEHGRAQNYASGGPGYWLSKRAYSLLVDKPILGVWKDNLTPYVEDLWTGNWLGRTFIGQLPAMDPPLKYFDDQHRFINHGSRFWPTKQNDVITSHLSCPERYTKDKMYSAHQAFLNS